MISDWKGKRVGVLGLGLEGFSSASYFFKKGALVTVLDEREKNELAPEAILQLEKQGISLTLGKKSLDNLGQYEILVRSPGIKLLRKELLEAKEEGVVITSQTQLFMDLCPCPVIGVTGTKGKGTTSSLIYEMLKNSGKDAYIGGNIGKAPLDFLDKLNPQSYAVLELSSFQLQDLKKSPHIAVMLMIMPEHLNYHSDMNEYVEAKRNILRFQKPSDFAVINRDYIASNESDVYTEARVFYITRERSNVKEGSFVRDGALWLRKDGNEKKVIDLKEIMLVGKHNFENAAAAAVAATLAGVGRESILTVLRSFKGLEHRLELVREVEGARYYDDSFSTTPETAIAAIEAFKEPEVIILGGSSKNSDFTELGKVISEAKNIKAIIGIGVEWERIKQTIDYSSSERSESRSSRQARTIKPLLIEGAKDMETIVQAAAKIAKSGDVVLLTPACASFDMFKSYKERGEQFKDAVRELHS